MTNKERMSKIGDMMDELVSLGFYEDGINRCKYMYKTPQATNKGLILGEEVYFSYDYVCIINRNFKFDYKSSNCKDDLILCVKKIIFNGKINARTKTH